MHWNADGRNSGVNCKYITLQLFTLHCSSVATLPMDPMCCMKSTYSSPPAPVMHGPVPTLTQLRYSESDILLKVLFSCPERALRNSWCGVCFTTLRMLRASAEEVATGMEFAWVWCECKAVDGSLERMHIRSVQSVLSDVQIRVSRGSSLRTSAVALWGKLDEDVLK